MNIFRINTKKIKTKGKIKFEIEKSKLELKKKHYELGLYISERNKKDAFDFSYDDKFADLLNEITEIKSYIYNLTKDKIKI